MPFSGSNFFDKGFFLSTDALLAVFLVIAFMSLALLSGFDHDITAPISGLSRSGRDTLVNLDENAVLFSIVDKNFPANQQMDLLEQKIVSLLPQRTHYRIELESYPYDPVLCQSTQSYDSCFSTPNIFPARGEALPADKTVAAKRFVFFRKGTQTFCSIGGAQSLQPKTKKPLPLAVMALFSPVEGFFSSEAWFSAASDANIGFSSKVTPSGTVQCDQNIRVDLNVSALSFGRKPVDLMMVMDRSGSMSWGGIVSGTSSRQLWLDANYAYIADGSGGLRSIRIDNPSLPLFYDQYNTPGTSYDDAKDSNFVYIADGASGFRIINAADPANLVSVSTVGSIGTAKGVAFAGNYSFVATANAGPIFDVTTTTTPNADLRLGYNSSESWLGQSFTTNNGVITGVEVLIRRNGNPSDLNVHLRSSINGTDLSSVAVVASSIPTSDTWIDANFPTPVPLTPGSIYYAVLTTSSQSTSNFYYWRYRNSNVYGGGQAYQQSSGLSGDLTLKTYVFGGLEVIDVSNKNAPFLAGTYSTQDAQKVFSLGNYLYFSDGVKGFKIFDVNAPRTPVLLGQLSTAFAQGLFVLGNTAFVADDSSGLRIVNVTNKSSPSLLATYNTPNIARDVWIDSNRAYVADSNSLQIIDVANPVSPTFLMEFATPYTYQGIVIRNNWAFIATGSTGLVTLDLSTGPRINQAKAAGSQFLDYNLWKSQDQLGLVSFSTSASMDHNLTNNHADVNATLYSLVAGGSTTIESGIRAAMPELISLLAISTAQDTRLRIGYSAGESTAGQSFLQIGNRSISGAKLYLQKVGSPGDLNLSLRSSIGGSNLTAGTITAGSVSTGSYNWYTISFSSSVALSDNTTYYIVASTTSQSSSNYYQWGRNSADAYWAGTAYQQSGSQSGDMTAQIAYVPTDQNPNALKFQLLMSDGQADAGNNQAAAQDANQLGIIIFTVAFGADADQNALQTIANLTGGQSYFASDQNTLTALYTLIAEQIGEIASAGKTQTVLDSNLWVPIPSGATVTDFNGGSFRKIGDQNYVYYFVDDLNGAKRTWSGYFILRYNCDSNYACNDQNRFLPPDGTFFEWKDANGIQQSPLPWDNNTALFVQYRDLTLNVFSADPGSGSNVLMDINVINAGYLSTNGSKVEILLNNPISGTVLNSVNVFPFSCGLKQTGCSSFFQLFFDLDSKQQGDLYAVINRDHNNSECPNNDVVRVLCTATQSEFFVLKLWTWK